MEGYYGPSGGATSTVTTAPSSIPNNSNALHLPQHPPPPPPPPQQQQQHVTANTQNIHPNNNKMKSQQQNHDTAKIFVGGLSWQTTEESLRYHFEQYGPVVTVEVMKDRATGDPRGFAFVVFEEDATIELVVASAHEINHKVVDVKRAQARGAAPPSIHNGMSVDGENIIAKGDGAVNAVKVEGGQSQSQSQQSSQQHQQQQNIHHNNHYGPQGGTSHTQNQNDNNNNQNQSHGGRNKTNNNNGGQQQPSPEQLRNKIFVGGLPLYLTDEALRQRFEEYGTIVDAIVMTDPNASQNDDGSTSATATTAAVRKSRGFGFVTFAQGSGGAQKCLAAAPVYVGEKYVEVKLATPKGNSGGVGNNSVGVNTGGTNGASLGVGPIGGGSGAGSGNGNEAHFAGLRDARSAEALISAANANFNGITAGMAGIETNNTNMNASTDASSSIVNVKVSGEYAGLSAGYGRKGWKAGFGTRAFGKMGWAVLEWDEDEEEEKDDSNSDGHDDDKETGVKVCNRGVGVGEGEGFSFELLEPPLLDIEKSLSPSITKNVSLEKTSSDNRKVDGDNKNAGGSKAVGVTPVITEKPGKGGKKRTRSSASSSGNNNSKSSGASSGSSKRKGGGNDRGKKEKRQRSTTTTGDGDRGSSTGVRDTKRNR